MFVDQPFSMTFTYIFYSLFANPRYIPYMLFFCYDVIMKNIGPWSIIINQRTFFILLITFYFSEFLHVQRQCTKISPRSAPTDTFECTRISFSSSISILLAKWKKKKKNTWKCTIYQFVCLFFSSFLLLIHVFHSYFEPSNNLSKPFISLTK